MTANYTDQVREIVGRHVPGHNDGIIATEILDLFLPVPMPTTATIEVREEQAVTFDSARARAIAATVQAEDFARKAHGDFNRADPLLRQAVTWSHLAQSWAAVAGILDVEDVTDAEGDFEAAMEAVDRLDR